MGKSKCCEKSTDLKVYKKCVNVVMTDSSGSGMSFQLTFKFTAIKKLNAIFQWGGYGPLTISNFSSTTALSFVGNFSTCSCECFSPKLSGYNTPILYQRSNNDPTTLYEVGSIGFNSSGYITITLNSSTNFANDQTITLLGGGGSYTV